jgi:hypothetical protein
VYSGGSLLEITVSWLICTQKTNFVFSQLEDELQRLLDLKRANLGAFIQNARQSLQELWDQLYFSEDEILEFSSAQSGMSNASPLCGVLLTIL